MGMQQQISDKDITGIGLATADRCARRIGRTLRLPAADIGDVRQDLLLELVRRAPRFDGQAGWPTFARLVIRHAGQDVADRLIRDRRRHGGSIDDNEQTSEDDGLAAWWQAASPERAPSTCVSTCNGSWTACPIGCSTSVAF